MGFPLPPLSGDLFPKFDWTLTLISQYANSPVLTQLLQDFDDCVNPAANLDAFFDLVWNVDTAVGYGLDVWGRIVGVVRTLQVSNVTYLGFKQQVPTVDSWDNAIWYSGKPSTSNFALTDNAFRTLILAKALANISDCSIKSINQILLNLFPGRGNCYVTDGENMTMTYTFQFALTPVEQAIVTQTNVLPRPAGVAATVVIV